MKRSRVRTRIPSQKIREASEQKRLSTPIVVKGVGPPRYLVLTPKEVAKLNIDESYQRIAIPHKIGDLLYSLREGGMIPDPVSIAERPDGSRWIVDGQQRFWAHSEAGVAMKACVYPVEDVDAERKLFLALNNITRLGADAVVQSWPGPVGVKVRELNEKPGPMQGKINFRTGHRAPYGASILAKAIYAMLTGGSPVGQIQPLLARANRAMTDDRHADAKVDSLVKLIAVVFPDRDHAKFLPVVAVALVCGRRWKTGIGEQFPTPVVVAKLKRINWAAIAPSWAMRFIPLLAAAVERRWPAAS